MCDSRLNVIHLIGADTPAARLETLKVLIACPELGGQRIVRFGGGSPPCDGLGNTEHVPAPLGVAWLARRSLRGLRRSTDPTILHIWSPQAHDWVLPAAVSERRTEAAGRFGLRLLLDVELPFGIARRAGCCSRFWSETRMGFVCATGVARRRLLEVGVARDDCVLIRDSVDFALINAARKSHDRRRLRRSNPGPVLLIVPPALRETGAFVAAWGALILAQVRPGVRLVIPGAGRESERVARLVRSCRHEEVLRQVGPPFSLCELLAAADLAVYLPSGDAPLSGVAWAMASGTPLVASAVPVTTELLAHGHNGWLCRADSPEEAARRMLRALDNPQQSKRQADLARSQAFGFFSRRRMIEQYRRAYENLLADRRPVAGIEDPVLVG